MTSINTAQVYDGLVIYTDGSFRRNRTGWGFHAYLYSAQPLTRGIGLKQLPTEEGYSTNDLTKTVTPLYYIDSYGRLPGDVSNNVAELVGAIEGIKFANTHQINKLFIRCDSEYTRKGITQWIKKWKKNGWKTAEGEPVKNVSYWKELDELYTAYKDAGKHIEFKWVKAHKGEPGNEQADLNAKTGGSIDDDHYIRVSDVEGYHTPKVDNNPLNLKKRMLFNIGADDLEPENGYHTYYLYHLGRSHNYAHKKEDSLTARHRKTDLLLGKRMADAMFSVMKTHERETYLDTLKILHTEHHARDIVEIGVACLDNACRPAIQDRIEKHGRNAIVVTDNNLSITTPQDDLISITLDPPRLGKEAVTEFTSMEMILNKHLAGETQKGVHKEDVTHVFFNIKEKEKPTPQTVYKLHSHITGGLTHLEVPVTYKGLSFKLRVLMGIDILPRNNLAKCADLKPTVTVYIVANGPESYSFGFIIDTQLGSAIYQSPYTQFLLPLPSKE